MWRKKAINLNQWREQVHESLQQNGIDRPLNSTLLLLASALNQAKTWILAHTEYEPTPKESKTIQNLTSRVASGHPLPYVLGYWAFFGREFKVTPDVLIPRPETEILVEIALQHAHQLKHPKLIDVGTGSGAIAVTLGAELPQADIIASDVSLPALRIASENARQHAQDRIQFLQADLLTPFRGFFDLVCANLPYIPSKKLQALEVSQWEPRLALDGGDDGLAFIEPLLHQAQTRMAQKGVILLEIESSLGTASKSLAAPFFPDAEIRLIRDLAGHNRVVEIKQG